MLDLSFNRIREIDGLDNLVNLEKLYLSSNRITKIENVNHLINLKMLELGDNKIKVCCFLFSVENVLFLFFKIKMQDLILILIYSPVK